MGGDLAPTETVAGAVAAAAAGVDVILVGDEEPIRAALATHDSVLPVVHASVTVDMGDDPGRALREKPDSSISVASRLVASGEAGGLVSAGSTGAAMAAAAIIIGRVPGVLRPSIASVFPTPGSPTLVLDSGANPDVKPEHLVQFAQMGAVAAEALFGITNPRVALLSIGEEKSKGRHLEREANRLLGATSLNFVGNVEGRDVATDSTDVIVTDGFTGNVFLKSVEGTAQMVMGLAVEALSKLEPDVRERAMGALKEVRAMLDYETYGGAQLLGVRGVVVICHGSSTRVAIANALQLASDAVDHELPERLAAAISG